MMFRMFPEYSPSRLTSFILFLIIHTAATPYSAATVLDQPE